MTYSFQFYEKDITTSWISDTLENELGHWKPKDVVFINSPTGSGKNTFIKDKLLPFAKQKNKKVLILSNRSALELQQKEEIYSFIQGDGFSKKYVEIAPVQLEEKYLFDNAIICSYQHFLFLLRLIVQQGLIQEIGYIVLDEAHFFIADSRFNSHTEVILDTILSYFFRTTTRIYMSATGTKINALIKEKEECFLNSIPLYQSVPLSQSKIPTFHFYHQKTDYSYCNFHFFERWQILANEIKKSPLDDKWLIFIRDKEYRSEIEKILKPIIPSNQILYIDAESKDSPVFRYIVKNKKFEGKVLVATSALDNGIGLHDPRLKHIVISTFDQESAIQMLGRKRRGANEKLNVYFRVPTAKEVKSAYDQTTQLLSVINVYKKDPQLFLNNFWGKLSPPMQKLFSLVPNEMLTKMSPTEFQRSNGYWLVLNNFARVKLSFDKELFGEFNHLFETTSENGFEKKVLSWFFGEEDVFSPNMLLKMDENEVKERIRSYIENLLEQELDKSQVEIHFKAIFEAYGELEGKREKSYSNSFKQDLNICLKDLSLPFSFTKLKRPRNEERWQFIELPDAI